MLSLRSFAKQTEMEVLAISSAVRGLFTRIFGSHPSVTNSPVKGSSIIALTNLPSKLSTTEKQRYIHNFIFIFPGYITNQFNDQLPVGLLAQLVRALHRYRRGQGSNPGKPEFFRLSFRNCISCVNNCEDLLSIYFFIPQFKYMNFIYS